MENTKTMQTMPTQNDLNMKVDGVAKTPSQLQLFTFGKGNKFDTADDIEPFLSKLRSLPDIQEIVTSGNTFGIEACKAFAQVLRSLKDFRVATFSDMFTGRLREEIPIALKAICDALIESTSLIELNLSDNAFGPAGAEPMQEFLENNRYYQVLKLNNNGLGVSGGIMIAKSLFKAAEKNKAENRESSLRTIIFGRNRLENGSSQALAEAFAAHGTLTQVRMPQNGIRPEGIEILIRQGLSKNPNLEILDLQDNTFTFSGAEALAESLPTWSKLELLNVSDCLLSAKGGIKLAEALHSGSNDLLHTIQMQYNEVDSKGISIIASAIESHFPKLKLLELNGNSLSSEDPAIQRVIAALEKHGNKDALDDLDDMEYDSEEDEDEEDEEEEEKEEEEEEKKRGRIVKEAEEEEEQKVAPEKNKEADELADKLAQTKI